MEQFGIDELAHELIAQGYLDSEADARCAAFKIIFAVEKGSDDDRDIEMLDSAPRPGEGVQRIGTLLCTIGRHAWEPQHHPGWDGIDSVYLRCRRCKAEVRRDGPHMTVRGIALGGV
jgi:hypothetical protein